MPSLPSSASMACSGTALLFYYFFKKSFQLVYIPEVYSSFLASFSRFLLSFILPSFCVLGKIFLNSFIFFTYYGKRLSFKLYFTTVFRCDKPHKEFTHIFSVDKSYNRRFKKTPSICNWWKSVSPFSYSFFLHTDGDRENWTAVCMCYGWE
jgi:hypothetical protein